MVQDKLISVIIPIYNSERFIEHTIESVRGQTYSNLEIICVNDGSTDKSKEILESIACQDERVVLINLENGGVSKARNIGLAKANGQYVMFVDSDDWIDLKTCEVAIKRMLLEEADIVMWPYVTETENRSTPKRLFDCEMILEKTEVRSKIHRRLVGVVGTELSHPELADGLCTVWGKLYKAEKIKNIEFIDLKKIGTYEDGLFNLYVFEQINKAVYITENFYHYRRQTGESITSGYRPKLYEQWLFLFKQLREYLDNNAFGDEYETAYWNRIAISILGLGMNISDSDYAALEKIRQIKTILANELFKNAYKQLDYSYFPLHWKVFYISAKYHNAFGIFVLLCLIKFITR